MLLDYTQFGQCYVIHMINPLNCSQSNCSHDVINLLNLWPINRSDRSPKDRSIDGRSLGTDPCQLRMNNAAKSIHHISYFPASRPSSVVLFCFSSLGAQSTIDIWYDKDQMYSVVLTGCPRKFVVIKRFIMLTGTSGTCFVALLDLNQSKTQDM